MHALDILGDPVRRRILELLADGESSAGTIGNVIQHEFGISQPAVSQQLRVLRDSGFTSVRPEGTRRLYALESAPLATADAWFDAFRSTWQPHLDALGTELARDRRDNRTSSSASATASDSTASDPTPAADKETPRG